MLSRELEKEQFCENKKEKQDQHLTFRLLLVFLTMKNKMENFHSAKGEIVVTWNTIIQREQP